MFDDLDRSEPNRPTLAPRPHAPKNRKDQELEEKRNQLKRRRGPRGSFLDRVDERLARLENMLHTCVRVEEEDQYTSSKRPIRRKRRRRHDASPHPHHTNSKNASSRPIPNPHSPPHPIPNPHSPPHQRQHTPNPTFGLSSPPPQHHCPDIWKQGISDLPSQALIIHCIIDDMSQEDLMTYVHYQSLLDRARSGALPTHLIFSYMCARTVREKTLLTMKQAEHYRNRAMALLENPELSLDSILSLLYLATFAFSRAEQSSASLLISSSIRISQELGLHTLDDGNPDRSHLSPEQHLHLERCRRLWWMQQTVDSFACLSLGRPRSIDIRDVCIRFPGDEMSWISPLPILPSYTAPLFDAAEFEQVILDLPLWTNPLHGSSPPSFCHMSNPSHSIYFPSPDSIWNTWTFRTALLSLVSGRIGHLVHGRSPRKAPPYTSPHSEFSLLRRTLWAIQSIFPPGIPKYGHLRRVGLTVYTLYYSSLIVLDRSCLRVHPGTRRLEATTSMAMRALHEVRELAHEVIILSRHIITPRGYPMPFLVFCAYLAGDIHLDRVWDSKVSEEDRLCSRSDFTTCLWIIRESGINWTIAHQYLMNLMSQMKRRLAGPTPTSNDDHDHPKPKAPVREDGEAQVLDEPLDNKERISLPFSPAFPVASRPAPTTPSDPSIPSTPSSHSSLEAGKKSSMSNG